MADVFISYKREDAARVRKLVAALRERGLDVWWDEDIPPSAPWEVTIEKALAGAKAVIVCWSPDAVVSENVRSEARVARQDGRLIQAFLRPCQPPLFFGERQAADLTGWRGKANDPRIAQLAETARKVAAGERVEGVESRSKWRFDRRIAGVAAALLLAIALGTGWWFLRPATASGPMTLAVLPFRALNPADANLVDAIWDDTRGAIGRNPNLRVIGRQAVEALAASHLQPAAYRKKLGADYLLDGTVQHVGDQVQMKLSLTRTSDAAEVWSGGVGGKLDDVFAFQQRIATEVEGRIRGRVAPGGGATARNIATSGEVYALFAEARAKTRQRNGPGWRAALPLLKKAVAIDPNYAPAWAELGMVTRVLGKGSLEQVRAEASGYARRALELAPNLAHAHAVLGEVQDASPEMEGEFRRAVALDPNDVEAWMWLGNCLHLQNRLREALQAHGRAVDIEPLWFTAMYNKMDDYAQLGDQPGLIAELRRAERTGDPYLTLRAREHVAALTGRIAQAAQDELEIRRRFPDQVARFDIVEILMRLGFVDDVPALFNLPASEVGPYKGMPFSEQQLRNRYADPLDFWRDDDAPMLYARLLAKNGRLREYVGYYKRAFSDADQFYGAIAQEGSLRFLDLAPNAAALLRTAGEGALAQQIIDKEEAVVAPLLRNAPPNWEMAWHVAQLRAAEGRDDEAMAMLRKSIGQGWLPDRAHFAVDIADEPCFGRFVGRADFQAVRNSILAHVASERRKITPALLQAGLVKTAA